MADYYSYDESYTRALKFWIFPHKIHSREIMPDGDYSMFDFLKKCNTEFAQSDEPRAELIVTDHPGADDFNLADDTLSDLKWYDRPLVTDEDYCQHYPYSGYQHIFIYGTEYIYPAAQFSFANEVHFLSDEHDAYLRDLWTQHKKEDNFVLSSYGSEEINSNINGGRGIFGADLATWGISYTQEYFPRPETPIISMNTK